MILEKYQNIFVEGETRTLDEKGVLIGHNFEYDELDLVFPFINKYILNLIHTIL